VEIAVSVGVAAAIFNSLIAIGMAFSRFLYASARDRVWPQAVNRLFFVLHPRLGSPYVATVLLLAVSIACCFLGERVLLVLISGDVFTGALIAAGVLLGRGRKVTGRDFRVPLHPLLPVFGLASAVAFILADLWDPDAGRPSILILSAVIAGAAVYYGLSLRRRGWSVSEVSPDR
jgi:amino acid transporter